MTERAELGKEEFFDTMFNGIEAICGDIEELGLENKSFDYCFCFQCLEHVYNPICALNELERVTRKMAFISIPLVHKTCIYDSQYWHTLKRKSIAEGGWFEQEVRDVDCHKFEFSGEDFKKIITQTKLKCIDNYPISYFTEMGSKNRNGVSYFNFFILQPSVTHDALKT